MNHYEYHDHNGKVYVKAQSKVEAIAEIGRKVGYYPTVSEVTKMPKGVYPPFRQ